MSIACVVWLFDETDGYGEVGSVRTWDVPRLPFEDVDFLNVADKAIVPLILQFEVVAD